MKKNSPQITWYLLTIFIFTFGLGILEVIFQTGVFYEILHKGFTAVPTGLLSMAFLIVLAVGLYVGLDKKYRFYDINMQKYLRRSMVR